MVINDPTMTTACVRDSSGDSCALFHEADRLSEQAYAVLEEPFSTETMHKFTEARKRADEKYRQAWQQWQYAQGGRSH
ncbi:MULTISPECIES: hypothetical protein [Pseudomonas]|jgi:hypothetical protein|uniref:Uncharacterized protein n=2 Tax=Pseudomonas TaxID=286 RepID=V8RDD7_9PSED|nr:MULTISPECIES: hypothetical protein [Pseudomonas]ETF09678.1 hypothetical protein PMO01_12130 [Pseudomonas moraviensis R28-S]UST76836.1 hypothetical protein NF675_12365 [Pseudomonas siliginis]VVO92478.1 hypothetical protein PS865_02415 [Pseudomonas fluorescens]